MIKEKSKETKVVDKKTQQKPKAKKENIFKRFFKKVKEVFSEIKKVSWPSFSKVLKQTAVVVGVVLIFIVIITLIDTGLIALLELAGKA